MTAPLTLTRPQARSTPREKVPQERTSAAMTELKPPARMPADAAESERIAATATSLAVACLEILNGIRRSDSIARWVDRQLLARIDHRAQLRADIAPSRPLRDLGAARALQPLRAHVCRVTDEIAEVTVVVRTPNRCRAVAIRLELFTARWTMTALQTM